MRKFNLKNERGIDCAFSNMVLMDIDSNDIDTKLRECPFNAYLFQDLLTRLSDEEHCLVYKKWVITFESNDLIKLKGKDKCGNKITLYIMESEENDREIPLF